MMDLNEKLAWVCRQFCIEDEFQDYETIQMGNVNCTYKVNFRLRDSGEPKSFLVQNVNTYAFRAPIALMENIDSVTEHIRRKNPGKLNLHFHHTADRKTYLIDGKNFWRMTNYVPSVTFDTAPNLDVVRSAGMAFGRFQQELSDFDIRSLYETIPDFHNTRSRFASLEEAARLDPAGRLGEVSGELDFLLSHKDQACTLTDLQMKGELPLRVTHNDTKINNVLFDPKDGHAMVVIDLDTVMPGLMGHDFGDAIRFAANRVEEDSRDYQRAGVDLKIFEAFSQGFLSQTACTMTEKEVDTLAISCFCLSAELAARFLDDYIRGDLYFKTRRPGHNLDRARCQIALAQDMLENLPQMDRIVRSCVEEAR